LEQTLLLNNPDFGNVTLTGSCRSLAAETRVQF